MNELIEWEVAYLLLGGKLSFFFTSRLGKLWHPDQYRHEIMTEAQ